jgi:hypothetical protein
MLKVNMVAPLIFMKECYKYMKVSVSASLDFFNNKYICPFKESFSFPRKIP